MEHTTPVIENIMYSIMASLQDREVITKIDVSYVRRIIAKVDLKKVPNNDKRNNCKEKEMKKKEGTK